MDLMERIKAECVRSTNCVECKLYDSENCKCMFLSIPWCWDIEAIRKALGETSDKASDKENIVVPEKIEMSSIAIPTPVENAITINQIINCIEKITERMK